MKSKLFNPSILIATVISVSLFFCIGLYRLEIDTDILDDLPADPIIQDALRVFKNHEIQDQLAVDVSLDNADVGRLAEYGQRVEDRLRESGLFKSVGFSDFGHAMPALLTSITRNLPLMFTEKGLMDQVLPLIEKDAVLKRLDELHRDLSNLDTIGQAEVIANDPLGLNRLVMARLASLAPSQNAYFYKERLISSDNRHLLVIAAPSSSGTDTLFSRKIVELMESISLSLTQEARQRSDRLTLTPVGAYRAALDNELIARKDVRKAILFAMAGVALLLLFAFPRPYIGLLSLLPSIAGTMTAFFVYSLFHKSISIMVLGFGGAIISMTVDYGIGYFLFLDRPEWSTGKNASREVRSVGLLALLTTIGAFAALSLSGFPLLQQLGEFTFLGMLLSFLFVHSVFPLIFPAIPPARPRSLPLQKIVNRLCRFGKRGAAVALLFALVMLFFAKPEFNVDLGSMNTVTKETAAADRLIASVWGNVLNKVFLLVQGESVTELQDKGDRFLKSLDQEISSGGLASGFVPSMIFPGRERRNENLSAWRSFWTGSRVAALKENLEKSADIGFSPSAFEPFYRTLESSWKPEEGMNIPEELYSLLGIKRSRDKSSWVQVMTFTTGSTFDNEHFYAAYRSLGSIFDPTLFSKKLGDLLFSTFLKMLFIVGSGVIVLVLLFFVNLRLTIVSLTPVIFAFICTLGTLNLLGRSLDISTLMLSIVAIGLGIDYSLYFVRSYQRYRDPSHPSFGLIRTTVFMAAATTLIGFGVLCFAEHNLLRSVGMTSTFAVGYALLGAFLLLPPLMEFLLQDQENTVYQGGDQKSRILRRYKNMETYPRLFARFKLLFDPMFQELPALLRFCPGKVRTILDIGTGYGVPACWLLEQFQGSKVYGIEPDAERAAFASKAVGKGGAIVTGRAPDLPPAPAPADLATMLDMVHYLNDEDLRLALERLYGTLSGKGTVIIRVAMTPRRKFPWTWWLEGLKLKAGGIRGSYRSAEEMASRIAEAGFAVEHSDFSGSHRELAWFVLKKQGVK
ncbi:MAG: methyltransferase domain-containing protein [Desulfobacteraceae bacterium]|nr:MAG: methyltransferase domain-containing protein [Desulfobacteraceae bacterium]